MKLQLTRKLARAYYKFKFLFKEISIEEGTNIYFGAILDTLYGGSIHIGKDCEIHKGSIILTYGGNIKFGNNCSINPYCVIYGHGGLIIGNGVRIATHTVIIPANHNFNRIDKFIYEQEETRLGIVIEDDVWIGAGVKILDGVKVAQGCVIAAGAVVTKSTQPYGIYAGVPAKFRKLRNE
jgi:acetyltransferase-like isoleucine patch superfamily enzyme